MKSTIYTKSRVKPTAFVMDITGKQVMLISSERVFINDRKKFVVR